MTKFSPVSLVKHCIIAFAVFIFGVVPALSQVTIFVDAAPPPLPVYEQPACPDDGYLWSPGYWAYGDYGYYWVPGTWVQPPQAGLLWTPAYWGWNNGNYAFYPGYWGTNVGFYGGVNYGYGYGGDGYGGGRWQNGRFFYNTSVNNVNSASIHNRYEDATFSRSAGSVSFNGGNGGIQAQPTARDQQYASQRHVHATSAQVAHVHAASMDRAQLATTNGGNPTTAAVATPKSYKQVAQQHAQAQPLTKKTAQKQQGVNSAQGNTGASSSPQAATQKKAPAVNTYAPPAENRNTLVQPSDKPAASTQQPRENMQPRPEAQAQPQPRPEAQSRPQQEAEPKPQPRPEAQSRPQQEAEPKPQPRPSVGAQQEPNRPQSN